MNLMLGIINVQTKKSHPKLGSIIGFLLFGILLLFTLSLFVVY